MFASGLERPSVWAIIAIAALVLFGYKKLPEMSRSVGKSLRIFKTEMKGMTDDDKTRDATTTANAAPVVTAPVATAPVATTPVVTAPVVAPQPVPPVAEAPVAPPVPVPSVNGQPVAAPTDQPKPPQPMGA